MWREKFNKEDPIHLLLQFLLLRSGFAKGPAISLFIQYENLQGQGTWNSSYKLKNYMTRRMTPTKQEPMTIPRVHFVAWPINVEAERNFVKSRCLKKQRIHAPVEAFLAILVICIFPQLPTQKQLIIAMSSLWHIIIDEVLSLFRSSLL